MNIIGTDTIFMTLPLMLANIFPKIELLVMDALIISPSEVFGDIMVLASPLLPCLPVDLMTRTLFQILYEGRYPLRYFAIEI